MTFGEALKKGYIIVVSNNTVAKELNEKFKTRSFASIDSSPDRFDGVKGIFIDQWISNQEKAIELLKNHINVFVGPLNMKYERK